jgi:hypothetical protein
MKTKIILLLAIAIAAALVTQPMRAVAITNFLVITENNSTSTGLTATLTTSSGTTSLTVTQPNSADNWFIALPGIGGDLQLWNEPEAGFFNLVQAQGVVNRIAVASDSSISGVPSIADDTPDTTTFTLNGSALSVTFDDDGDVAAVPDTGSTLGLLSLSVVALLGATRLRFLQLAA